MKKQDKSLKRKIEQEQNYVDFLKKRLESENFKSAVTEEEYKLTRKKYDKAKLKLKFLKDAESSGNS